MKDINKIKKIIAIFYYLNIIYTPFRAGTAAISEISLFTLWDKYININGDKPLYINENIMIDVEALSHSFTDFYHNCFHKNKLDRKYTPYLSINKNNNNYPISHNTSRNNIVRNYYLKKPLHYRKKIY